MLSFLPSRAYTFSRYIKRLTETHNNLYHTAQCHRKQIAKRQDILLARIEGHPTWHSAFTWLWKWNWRAFGVLAVCPTPWTFPSPELFSHPAILTACLRSKFPAMMTNRKSMTISTHVAATCLTREAAPHTLRFGVRRGLAMVSKATFKTRRWQVPAWNSLMSVHIPPLCR